MPNSTPPATIQPRPRKATLNMIAQRTGYSLNAVSDIINRNRADKYRATTVEKITQVARELNYRRNPVSQMLLNNRSQTIGFVTLGLHQNNTVANHVVYPFVLGANTTFATKGYHVALVNITEVRTATGESRLPYLLEDQFCDGLILQKGRWSDIQNWIDSCAFPLILWDSGIFKEHNCIYRDEYQVGWLLTKQLISLGHRRIAYMGHSLNWTLFHTSPSSQMIGERIRTQGLNGLDLSGEEAHYSSILRYQGCLAAAQEHGLPISVIIRERASDMAPQLKEKAPTALIYDSGVNVDPLITHAADMLGWRIPQDLTVVSCDVDPKTAHDGFLPALGGIVYDRYQVGGMAADMMFRALAQPGGKIPSIKLIGEFIRGDSTAEPAAR
jgi:DNA-binding LacI/PurR family transcriptional regulator